MLTILSCLDSDEMAEARKRELRLPRELCASLGISALRACMDGYYIDAKDEVVDWSREVEVAIRSKVSLPPDAPLPSATSSSFKETRVQVMNETTLSASKQLVDAGHRPLALNFANGFFAGGGFLGGARAQEEALCRSSALYATLVDDAMYEAHSARASHDSTDWAILSPDVPVFRTDDGTVLDEPWLLSFITCAAPVAYDVGQPLAGELLHRRVVRVLAIARAYQYSTLVLGAWGCGAFGNDPARTAGDFRGALEGEFAGAFSDVVFAITDWSPERRTLGPFCEIFS